MAAESDPKRMLVSVILPVYNGADLISRAIDSVLSQTHRNLELLVIDDGSTDGTPDVVAAYEDPRITYVWESNEGLPQARNKGLRRARGELAAFLDHDDYWFPHKLETQISALGRDPTLVAVGCLMHRVSASGTVLGVMGEPIRPSTRRRIAKGLVPFAISSMLVRRSAIDSVGWFDQALPTAADLDLIVRLAQLGPISSVNKVLGAQTIHGGSMTSRHYEQQAVEASFVAARAAKRASGQDLAFDDFLASYRPSLRRRWLIRAHRWYWIAAVSVAERRWGTAFRYGTLAVLGRPLRTPWRFIVRRLQRRRR